MAQLVEPPPESLPDFEHPYQESVYRLSEAWGRGVRALIDELVELDTIRSQRGGHMEKITGSSPLLVKESVEFTRQALAQILLGCSREAIEMFIDNSFDWNNTAHLALMPEQNKRIQTRGQKEVFPIIYVLVHNCEGWQLHKHQCRKIVNGVRRYMRATTQKDKKWARWIDSALDGNVPGTDRRYKQAEHSEDDALAWADAMEGRMAELKDNDLVPWVLYVGFTTRPNARWVEHIQPNGHGLKQLMMALTHRLLEPSYGTNGDHRCIFGLEGVTIYECTASLQSNIGEHGFSVLLHSYVYEGGLNTVTGGLSVVGSRKSPDEVYERLEADAMQGRWLMANTDAEIVRREKHIANGLIVAEARRLIQSIKDDEAALAIAAPPDNTIHDPGLASIPPEQSVQPPGPIQHELAPPARQQPIPPATFLEIAAETDDVVDNIVDDHGESSDEENLPWAELRELQDIVTDLEESQPYYDLIAELIPLWKKVQAWTLAERQQAFEDLNAVDVAEDPWAKMEVRMVKVEEGEEDGSVEVAEDQVLDSSSSSESSEEEAEEMSEDHGDSDEWETDEEEA